MNTFDSTLTIVGAGPVACWPHFWLPIRNVVTLIEKELIRSPNSRAIGIAPLSLEILKRIDLDGAFISHGISVEFSEAHARKMRLGKLNFSGINSDFHFILSITQDKTEEILEKAVKARKSITFLRGYRAESIHEDSDHALYIGHNA